MIYVNTGDGKGKTTAAVGQVIRSLGSGWKVCIIQMFKDRSFYGEQKILKKLPGSTFFSYAPRHPACFKSAKRTVVRKQCAEALKKAQSILTGSKKYNLVVLEEFNIAVRDGFFSTEKLLEVLAYNRIGAHVIVTGRGAPKKLIAAADLVTEMNDVKHPYRRGIKAQKGIEF